MSYNPLAAHNSPLQAIQASTMLNGGLSETYACCPASSLAPPSPGAASAQTPYRPPDLMHDYLLPHLLQPLEQQQTSSAPSVLNKQYNPLLHQQVQPLPAALPGVLHMLASGRDTRSGNHTSNAQQVADCWVLTGPAPGTITAVSSAATAAGASTGGMHYAVLQETTPAHQVQELSLEVRATDLQHSTKDLPWQQDAYWPAVSGMQQNGTCADDPWASVLSKPQGESAGRQAAASAALAAHSAGCGSMQLGGNLKGTKTAAVSWEAVLASSAAVAQPQQVQRSTSAGAPSAAATSHWDSSDVSLVTAPADSWESLASTSEPQAAAHLSAGTGTDNWEAAMEASADPQGAAHVLRQHSNRGITTSVSGTVAATGKRDTAKASTGPQSAARVQQRDTANAGAGAGGVAAAQAASRCIPEQRPWHAKETAEATGHAGGGVTEMALTQLRHERPDVAMHTTKELRGKISAMPLEIALAAVGELAELPQGWADGLGMVSRAARGGKAASWEAHKQQQKSAATKHLEGVVARAAAHAHTSGSSHNGAHGAQGAGNWGSSAADVSVAGRYDGWQGELADAGEEDGWLTIRTAGSSPAGFGSTSGTRKKGDVTVATLRAAVGAAAATDGTGGDSIVGGSTGRNAAGRQVAAAWAKLESERPDVVMCLDERHMKLISNLSKEQQVQVLAMLHTLSSRQVDSSKPRAGIAKNLTMVIANYLHILRQTDASKITAGLKQIVQKHPHLVPYMDDQLVSRLAVLNQSEAQITLGALDKAGQDANASWQQRCNNHSAWLMRTITNALRAAGQ